MGEGKWELSGKREMGREGKWKGDEAMFPSSPFVPTISRFPLPTFTSPDAPSYFPY